MEGEGKTRDLSRNEGASVTTIHQPVYVPLEGGDLSLIFMIDL